MVEGVRSLCTTTGKLKEADDSINGRLRDLQSVVSLLSYDPVSNNSATLGAVPSCVNLARI